MRIRYTKEAVKTLKRSNARTRERIIAHIEGLLKQPPEGDIRPLLEVYDKLAQSQAEVGSGANLQTLDEVFTEYRKKYGTVNGAI